MSAPVEYREKEPIIELYRETNLPKFGIFLKIGTEPKFYYEGTDIEEGTDALEKWLERIEESGMPAEYILRVYNNNEKELSKKSQPKYQTRFQLVPTPSRDLANSKYATATDPTGKTIVVMDQGRPVMNTIGNTSNNAGMQSLIDSNKQVMELLMKMMQKQQDNKMDVLIKLLTDKVNPPVPEKETWEDRFIGLGKTIIDKPDIIDRIGYIFKPEIYQRVEQSLQLAGTEKKEVPNTTSAPELDVKDKIVAEKSETSDLSEDEIYDRTNIAMDKLDAAIGAKQVMEILEIIANSGKAEKLTPGGVKQMLTFI